MKRYLRLYLSFMRICAMRELESRGSFVVGFLVVIAFPWFPLLFAGAIYGQTGSLGGWTFHQYLVLLGTFQIISALIFMFFLRNIMNLPEYVRKGELDFFLLKPVNSQFLISTRYLAFNEVAQALPGTALVVYGLVNLGTPVDLWRLPIYLFFVGTAVIIGYSFWFLLVTPCIWTVRLESHEIFFAVLEVGRFHPSMFGGVVRVLLLTILPVGVMAATPADMLLNRLSWEAALWALGLSAGLLWLSHRFWKFAQTRYYGASS
jgi:ABC-2 type transport system permease protein